MHIQNLNHTFRQSQSSPHSTAIIADGGVKKSNVASAVIYTWSDNSVTSQHCAQTMNIISMEAKLMSIRIGLIPAIDNKDNHQILVITDTISAAKKILESQPNPLQKAILLIADGIKVFFSRDSRNVIHFWQCPNKAEWPRHKLVDDQVKATINIPTHPSRNSYLFNRKKECDDTLKEWQNLFSISQKKDQQFLDFEDEKQNVIKPTYSKGGSWLPSISFTNALCACFICMTTGYTPIGEYQQQFFPNSPLNCSCGQAELQTQEHIVMHCPLHNSTRPYNIVINSFVHFLNNNPSAFCFNNG